MKSRDYIKWIFNIIIISTVLLPSGYSQSPPIPPPVAVPEGNMFTAVFLVGSGLYLLWKKEGGKVE
jgi:hypothetical protein